MRTFLGHDFQTNQEISLCIHNQPAGRDDTSGSGSESRMGGCASAHHPSGYSSTMGNSSFGDNHDPAGTRGEHGKKLNPLDTSHCFGIWRSIFRSARNL